MTDKAVTLAKIVVEGKVDNPYRPLAQAVLDLTAENDRLRGKWNDAGDRCPQCGEGQQPRIDQWKERAEQAEAEVVRLRAGVNQVLTWRTMGTQRISPFSEMHLRALLNGRGA